MKTAKWLLLLMIVAAAFSCRTGSHAQYNCPHLSPFIYDNGPDYVEEGLFRFVENGKMGFANPNCEVVIPARFDFVAPFENGRAQYIMGGQAILMDEDDLDHHYIWTGGYATGYINHLGEQFPQPFPYWQPIAFKKSLQDTVFVTHCEKNGTMIEKAYVYLDKDTLYIDFPAQLPAYWDDVSLKVKGTRLHAEAFGIPFAPEDIIFTPAGQRLQLNKQHYAIGDTLYASLDLLFHYITAPYSDEDTVEQGNYTLKGVICEIVRAPDFNPFDAQNFMTFDLPTALRELGEPLSRERFNTHSLPEFRAALLNLFPASADIWLEELTWDISPTRDISDEGKERLTIWYHQSDGLHWQLVHYIFWNEELDF